MDKNKMIASVIAVLLTIAGGVFGYNYKEAVCGNPDAKSAAQPSSK